MNACQSNGPISYSDLLTHLDPNLLPHSRGLSLILQPWCKDGDFFPVGMPTLYQEMFSYKPFFYGSYISMQVHQHLWYWNALFYDIYPEKISFLETFAISLCIQSILDFVLSYALFMSKNMLPHTVIFISSNNPRHVLKWALLILILCFTNSYSETQVTFKPMIPSYACVLYKIV